MSNEIKNKSLMLKEAIERQIELFVADGLPSNLVWYILNQIQSESLGDN